MLRNIITRASAPLGSAMVLLSAILLSGCSTDTAAFGDGYVPETHYERHPIKVAKVPVKMGIAAKAGILTPE
ncbi:MAG: hypothetical protein ACREDX_06055, partial [Aestuariivirga sp.]